MKNLMNESDTESNELEAEIMAPFLLRPVIVLESIYAFTPHEKPCQLLNPPWYKQRDVFEEYSFRIRDEWHYVKANCYCFLDQLTFVYCLGS